MSANADFVNHLQREPPGSRRSRKNKLPSIGGERIVRCLLNQPWGFQLT